MQRVLALALTLSIAAVALADEPSGGVPLKVHDHVAYVFRVPLGTRAPALRAADAAASLTSVIDDEVPGDVDVRSTDDTLEVAVGNRLLFRLGAEDARVDGARNLSEYAPRVQTELQSFLTKERRRAFLQRAVLEVSLAVFFAVLVWVLLRAFFRATRSFEDRLERGEQLPDRLRQLGLLEEKRRGSVLFALSALRIAVTLGALYLFLLASLSLFEGARPFRDRLVLWAAAPFRALGERLVHGLPNLLLLVVVLAVLRGGWRAMTVGFTRLSAQNEPGALAPHQVIPFRLLARTALVIGGLVVLPLVLGSDGGLFNEVGLELLAVAGLASVPLLANVAVGIFALFTNQFPAGRWLSVRLLSGKALAGEVTSVDFFHVRLVPEAGGEVRLPHLLTLWTPIDHRPATRALAVDFPVLRQAMPVARALAALTEAATQVAQRQGLKGAPSVELRELTESVALFRVALPDGAESARTQLLLALEDATRSDQGVRA